MYFAPVISVTIALELVAVVFLVTRALVIEGNFKSFCYEALEVSKVCETNTNLSRISLDCSIENPVF